MSTHTTIPDEPCLHDDGHCWHGSHTLTCNPPINVSTCCHCGGEMREQTWPDRDGHGPHQPGFMSGGTLLQWTDL